MLFDLRGAGRRKTIQMVYILLAVLMGGGLVLFGIGGSVSGGLIDAITNNSGSASSGLDTYRNRVNQAQRQANAHPEDAAAWAALARAPFARLAILAWDAGQTRKGDLASQKAVSLADPSERAVLKTQLDQAKQQS